MWRDDSVTESGLPSAATRAQLTRRIQEHLLDSGIESSLDLDGDLEFHVVGQDRELVMYASVAQDVTALRVFGQWDLTDPIPKDDASRLRRCNDLNRDLSLTKFSIADDWLIVAVDLPLPEATRSPGLISMGIAKVVQDSAFYYSGWH